MQKTNLHPDIYFGSALILFIITILALLATYPGIFPAQIITSACTEEVKVCADGSLVTRGGASCDFAPCLSGDKFMKPGITEEPFEAPSATPSTKKPAPIEEEVMCTMEVKLCSDGSFVGRVAPKCDFAPCPDLLEYESDH
ncbi:MAG: hypothetical protein KBD27_02040 [Candidatus Moranbacteria bacterium]|nr:hypothetical protein [Candidatus Moranbacteria bacterium]